MTVSSCQIHSSKLITNTTEGRFNSSSGGKLNPEDWISAYSSSKQKCNPQPPGQNACFLASSGALRGEARSVELLGVEHQCLGPTFVLVPIYFLVYHHVEASATSSSVNIVT